MAVETDGTDDGETEMHHLILHQFSQKFEPLVHGLQNWVDLHPKFQLCIPFGWWLEGISIQSLMNG